MEGIFMIKNVSVKLFNFFNGGIIDDQERVCKTLRFLQWSVYRWSRTCLSKSSASLMDGIFVIKNVSVNLFSFFNGGCIGDQERVCQTLQFLQWREYWWSRMCLSTLFSSLNGGCIGDQERVCQTLQLLPWRMYWWSRSVCQNPSASPMECVQVIQERVCQSRQLL